MKEIAILPKDKILTNTGIGRVCIDYTDPITGKIKEQVKGNNHIYEKMLFNRYFYDTSYNAAATLYLAGAGGKDTLDNSFPYITGTPIGYGMPLATASGNYKGGWNAGLSTRFLRTTYGYYSKHVYDFFPYQALGVVKKVAMGHQFGSSPEVNLFPMGMIPNYGPFASNPSTQCIAVGTKIYNIDTLGIVRICDLYSGSDITINTAAITYPGGGYSTYLGFEPDTGHFFVWTYHGTAGNRRMREFSDATFTTVVNTWSPSNLVNFQSPFYVHGGKAYRIFTTMTRYDFVNNIAGVDMTMAPATGYDKGAINPSNVKCINYDNFILAFGMNSVGYIFDLLTETVVGYLGTGSSTSNLQISRYAYDTFFLAFAQTDTATANIMIPGIFCMYHLPGDAPVRPAGYGMSVSYELEYHLT